MDEERLILAMVAMHGLLSSGRVDVDSVCPGPLADVCVKVADALIAELDKVKP